MEAAPTPPTALPPPEALTGSQPSRSEVSARLVAREYLTHMLPMLDWCASVIRRSEGYHRGLASCAATMYVWNLVRKVQLAVRDDDDLSRALVMSLQEDADDRQRQTSEDIEFAQAIAMSLQDAYDREYDDDDLFEVTFIHYRSGEESRLLLLGSTTVEEMRTMMLKDVDPEHVIIIEPDRMHVIPCRRTVSHLLHCLANGGPLTLRWMRTDGDTWG